MDVLYNENPILKEEKKEFRYYKLFKELLSSKFKTLGIKLKEALLYGFMSDLKKLSIKNQWEDAHIRLSKKRVCVEFGWDKKTTYSAFKALETAGLIREEQVKDDSGLMRSNKVFLKDLSVWNKERGFCENSDNESFYLLPGVLFRDEEYKKLSLNSKALFAVLLDRAKLNLALQKETALNKPLKAVLPIDAAMNLLQLSRTTIFGSFKSLKKAELLEKEVNPYSPHRDIYLRDIENSHKGIEIPKKEEHEKSLKKSNSANAKEVNLARQNAPEKNNNELAEKIALMQKKSPKELSKSLLHFEKVSSYISSLSVGDEKEKHQGLLESFVLEVEALLKKKDFFVSGNRYDVSTLLSHLMKTTALEIYQAILHIGKQMKNVVIKDLSAYIRACLLKAHTQHQASAYYLGLNSNIKDEAFELPKTEKEIEAENKAKLKQKLMADSTIFANTAFMENDYLAMLHSVTEKDKTEATSLYKKDYKNILRKLQALGHPLEYAKEYLGINMENPILKEVEIQFRKELGKEI